MSIKTQKRVSNGVKTVIAEVSAKHIFHGSIVFIVAIVLLVLFSDPIYRNIGVYGNCLKGRVPAVIHRHFKNDSERQKIANAEKTDNLLSNIDDQADLLNSKYANKLKFYFNYNKELLSGGYGVHLIHYETGIFYPDSKEFKDMSFYDLGDVYNYEFGYKWYNKEYKEITKEACKKMLDQNSYLIVQQLSNGVCQSRSRSWDDNTRLLYFSGDGKFVCGGSAVSSISGP